MVKKRIFETLKDKDSFFKVPTGPVPNLVMQTLGSNGDITNIRKHSLTTRTGTAYSLLEDGKKRLIKATNGENEIYIEIADIERLIGSRKGVKKMFYYFLLALNEQAYSAGILKQNYITFPLQSLIDVGIYKTVQSARRGFNDASSTLATLQIKGKLIQNKGKKKITTIEGFEVMFTGAFIKNNMCVVRLNEYINWGFIASYYTIAPTYTLSLKNNAFELNTYIFSLARQNLEKIKERGYFTISLKAVHSRLNLPAVEGNSNPSRTIKEPIEAAIEEIEDKNLSHNVAGFTITPVYNENGNIKDYIENGYLKIEFDKGFAGYFIGIATDKQSKIETAIKKKEARIEKAKTIALSKTIEKETN